MLFSIWQLREESLGLQQKIKVAKDGQKVKLACTLVQGEILYPNYVFCLSVCFTLIYSPEVVYL